MIPVSTLLDEYIEWRELSEQKAPFDYIVPPPSRGVGTMILQGCFYSACTAKSNKINKNNRNELDQNMALTYLGLPLFGQIEIKFKTSSCDKINF